MYQRTKTLFILKLRHTYNGEQEVHLSSGLYNSARFVQEMMRENGLDTKLVQVVDNNDIDREVTKYKPTHVIIEAYWVVPEKFAVLTKLHPTVTWIIRNHSELPFLANEGIAVGWTIDYLRYPKVIVSSNALRANEEMQFLVGQAYPHWTKKEIESRVVYLPNYYPLSHKPKRKINDRKDYINIGCFGAIRPLKNHLLQAIAAMKFADRLGKKLHFHINVGRVEGRGEPILKNLRELFAREPKHELIEHSWMNHSDFLKLVHSMDIGMQVSFTESFNIVAADFVSQGVPVVVSPEIFWVAEQFKADPNNSESIVGRLQCAWFFKKYLNWLDPSYKGLKQYDIKSEKIWTKYFAYNVPGRFNC